MTKKVKILPESRSEWSFGGLVYRHFFIYGTRPDGDPAEPVGRVWEPKEAFYALGLKSPNTFWNWIDDKHFPLGTAKLEKVLFGDSKLFAAERLELQEKLRLARAAIPAAAGTVMQLPVSYQPEEFEPSAEDAGPEAPAEIEVDASGEPETGEEDGKVVVWRPYALATRNEEERAGPTSAGFLAIGDAIRLHWWSTGRGTSAPRRRGVPLLVAALALLLGIYSWVQWLRPDAQSGAKRQESTAEIVRPKQPDVVAGASQQTAKTTALENGLNSAPLPQPKQPDVVAAASQQTPKTTTLKVGLNHAPLPQPPFLALTVPQDGRHPERIIRVSITAPSSRIDASIRKSMRDQFGVNGLILTSYQVGPVQVAFDLDIGLKSSSANTPDCNNEQRLSFTYEIRSLLVKNESGMNRNLVEGGECFERHTAEELIAAEDAAIRKAVRAIAADARSYLER